MSRHRLRKPELIHSEYQAGSYGALTVKDMERLRAEEIVFRGRGPVPTLTGSWADGTAGRNLSQLLVQLGLIDDQSQTGDMIELGGMGAEATFTAHANAGTGASVAGSFGTDRGGIATVVGGTGAVSGIVITVTFAVARADVNYRVHLTAGTSAAAGLAGFHYTGRTVDSFAIATTSALASGQTYSFGYTVEGGE